MSVFAGDYRMPDLSRGLCRGRMAEFWDVDSRNGVRAKQVCKSGCPVLRACRDWGVRHEVYNCWGGLVGSELEAERRRLGIKVDEPSYSHWLPRAAATRPADASQESAIRAWAVDDGWHIPDGPLPGAVIVAYQRAHGGVSWPVVVS